MEILRELTGLERIIIIIIISNIFCVTSRLLIWILCGGHQIKRAPSKDEGIAAAYNNFPRVRVAGVEI